MSQNLQFKLAGLFTAPSSIEGLPPGSLEVCDNIEIRYKNLATSRRGFQSLNVTAVPDGGSIIRVTDFYITGVLTQICLTSLGNLYYFAGGAWNALPGIHGGITPPNSVNAKSRFYKIGQSLYLTTGDGILSMASASGSRMINAGVQKALDLTATNANSSTGFLGNNPVGTLTGASMTIGTNLIGGFTSLSDLSALAVGQYVSGGLTNAYRVIQDLTYTAQDAYQGTVGNSITVAYTAGGTAGSEVVTVSGTAISVSIQSGVSTAYQIAVAVAGNVNSSALVSIQITGTYTTAQTSVGATALASGVNSVLTTGSTITDISQAATLFSTSVNLFTTSPYITNLSSVSSIIDSATNPVSATLVSGTGLYAGTYVNSIIQSDCTFTTSAANATFGAVYSNNGHNFTVENTYVGATTLVFDGVGRSTPGTSGTLTKVSGVGDATITFSSVEVLWEISVSPIPFQAGTGVVVVFSTPPLITISNPITATATNTNFTAYAGSQVAYQMVFGRVETDINGNTQTLLGAPSQVATVYNNWPSNTNVTVVGTIPKNCSTSLTFVQLYRSAISAGYAQAPLQQFQLVYEAALTAGNFSDRQITITDSTLDSLRGASLYTGTDQGGANAANNPPPMAWDICAFRDFVLYANCTQPSTLQVSILAVGTSGSVLQSGDTITIVSNGTAVFTAGSSEVLATQHFKVYTTGTPAQNIADTTASLVRVINYFESCHVHAIPVNNSLDLPSFILESDYPVTGTFTVTASAHTTAYNPVLSSAVSALNITPNDMYVSASGQPAAVPAFNVYPVDNSSSPIYRILSSSSTYAYAIKTDGIYQVFGYTPAQLTIITFDLTTHIIGADTAVSLNSQVWMFSNQGVVAISDSGVNGQSAISIQNVFDELTAANLSAIQQASFAIGYESDQKYLLALPTGNLTYCDVQYCFNYVTNAWTTWSRNLQFGYINKSQDLIYICRADSTNKTISYERNVGNYTDFSDESFPVTIADISDKTITLVSNSGIVVGDVLYQSSLLYSAITNVSTDGLTITVLDALAFTAVAASILPGITCTIEWKQVYGDNPAMTKQFGEGLALFRNNNFYEGYLSFTTDFANDGTIVPFFGDTGGDRWGLFDWGGEAWGEAETDAQNSRFYVPANQQFGSYLAPTLQIRQAYSTWELQGLSITYEDQSSEVGI